jgi:ribosomal protein S18 acetylase RimI-like enzyme
MITIRKGSLHDAEYIATYLMLAMEEIVYKFIGERDAKKARDFMLYFAERENNQYSYQNCWVAEDEEQVVAAVNLYAGADLNELRQPVITRIREQYSNNVMPEDETEPGEYYIDSLGVNCSQQGKGIGSQMLRFLIDEYVHKRGETLGLLVDDDNLKARKLYLNLGFKTVGKKALLGKTVEHLQIKPSFTLPSS